ncbi:MAG: elongation factor P [Patescibacteria group bacterium]
MGDTNDIKKGSVIRRHGELYAVVGFQFVNPGKGAAFTKTKMKGIASGKTIEITYKSGEAVDTVYINRKSMQYLYNNGAVYSFMDQENYETLDVNLNIIGEDAKYLKDGLVVVMALHDGNPVAIELPKKIKYSVAEAPPAVKGDTASGNVTKEIALDNGLKIRAPIFIKEGEEVLVNTETGEYAGRASE